jgi:peptide-methionine (S)-S-oxide reductase
MNRPGSKTILALAVIGIALIAITASVTTSEAASMAARTAEAAATPDTGLEVATFAGGCFWSMVAPYEKLEGVVSVVVGYTGGHVKDPTYEQVSEGGTGHVESVQLMYDPRKVSYEKLLDVFWHNVDPTVVDHQFCDYGPSYRSEIFYHTESQKRLADQSKAELEKSKPFKDPIVTQVTAASAFYKAEEYHQNFSKKNPIRYKIYRLNCRRDERLKELWGKTRTGG